MLLFTLAGRRLGRFFNLAKANGIYDEETESLTEKERFQKEIFFPIGDPNDDFAQYFVGQSYLAPVST